MKSVKIFQNNPGFFISYLFFLIAGGVLLIAIPKNDLIIFINQQHNIIYDNFFYFITFLGTGWFFAIIVLFLFFRYSKLHGITGGIIFGITSGIAQLLKHFVFDDSMRPKKLLEGIYELHFVEGLDIHSHYSFPSGHSITAFSVFCLLSLIQKKSRNGVVYFTIAMLVGISRVYLGQHFFTDVYVGALLGVILTCLVYFFMEKYLKQLEEEQI